MTDTTTTSTKNTAQLERANRFLRIGLILLLVYLGLQLFGDRGNDQAESLAAGEGSAVSVKWDSKRYVAGVAPTMTVQADSSVSGDVMYEVYEVVGRDETVVASGVLELDGGGSESLKLEDIVMDTGRYVAVVTAEGSPDASAEVEVRDAGFFRGIWRAVFYRPMENILIGLLSWVTWGHLGVAVILLTLIVKSVLLVPSARAIRSQRAMQVVQPELNRIKEKYKNEPQKQASEMMAVWKKHKANPAGAILPMLIQFPVLIALFLVIQNGLTVSNTPLLYGALSGFDWSSINANLLPGIWNSLLSPWQHIVNGGVLGWMTVVLPLGVAGLQFWQMKNLQKGKPKPKKLKEGEAPDFQTVMQSQMLYMMPVMIGGFCFFFPMAVGLYWGVSTGFSLVQQLVMGKKNAGVKSDVIDVEVRVKKVD